MRTLLKVGFGLLVLSFVLIALTFSVLRAKGTSRGANPEGRTLVTENRTILPEATQIDLNGPINLTLRQGAVASLSVRGEQRLLANVDTTQEGKLLRIGIKGMMLHHRHPLQVTLVLPEIEKLNIRGNGDSTVNGFSGSKIELSLAGSGDVKFNGRYKDVMATLQGSGDMEMNGGSSDKVFVELVGSGNLTVVGQCKEFKAEQTGSGDIDAEHLTAEHTTVSLRGSGNSVVQAMKVANVTLRGNGDVAVIGQPGERTIDKTGSGDVTFR